MTKKISQPIGIRVNDPSYAELRSDYPEEFTKAIQREWDRNKLQLVVCVLPTNKKDRYDAIKVLCCYELGVPSQCVVSKSIQRKQTVLSVCNKIIQQINCKLGGQLWQVNGVYIPPLPSPFFF